MRSEVCNIGGESYIRVNKKVARNLWNEGKGIVMMPNLVNPNGAWFTPSVQFNDGTTNFDKVVNEFVDSNAEKSIKRFTFDART